MEREKIFFENKGLSSTMKGYLLLFSIIWVGITVLQIMLFLNLFRDVSEANGGNFFQALHEVFMKLGILDILGFLYAVILGSFYSAFSIAGSKLSMKIYESHIEGRAAVGTKIKDVYIPIEEVNSLATGRGDMLSSITVQTKEGFGITFYMDEEKVYIVKQMLQNKISLDGENREFYL